jgi:hypothetical protein
MLGVIGLKRSVWNLEFLIASWMRYKATQGAPLVMRMVM